MMISQCSDTPRNVILIGCWKLSTCM